MKPTTIALTVLTGVILLGAPARARAEGFISPFIGFNFGGDSSCPAVQGCQDKRMNYGIALGASGSFLGLEEEFAYAKAFFGTSPILTNWSVLRFMSSVIPAPKI